MKLYFLRHASASEIAPSDSERELTKEGKEEARIAGAALAELGVKPVHVLSSPLVRARQTAKIAAQGLQFSGEIVPLDELTNGATTADLLRALKPYATGGEILLVGHMPSLAGHMAVLIGAKNAESFALGKGGIGCVELERLHSGAGRLRWLMRQSQLRQIAK